MSNQLRPFGSLPMFLPESCSGEVRRYVGIGALKASFSPLDTFHCSVLKDQPWFSPTLPDAVPSHRYDRQ